MGLDFSWAELIRGVLPRAPQVLVAVWKPICPLNCTYGGILDNIGYPGGCAGIAVLFGLYAVRCAAP